MISKLAQTSHFSICLALLFSLTGCFDFTGPVTFAEQPQGGSTGSTGTTGTTTGSTVGLGGDGSPLSCVATITGMGTWDNGTNAEITVLNLSIKAEGGTGPYLITQVYQNGQAAFTIQGESSNGFTSEIDVVAKFVGSPTDGSQFSVVIQVQSSTLATTCTLNPSTVGTTNGSGSSPVPPQTPPPATGSGSSAGTESGNLTSVDWKLVQSTDATYSGLPHNTFIYRFNTDGTGFIYRVTNDAMNTVPLEAFNYSLTSGDGSSGHLNLSVEKVAGQTGMSIQFDFSLSGQLTLERSGYSYVFTPIGR